MNLNFEYSNDYLSYINSLKDNEIYSDNGFIELFSFNELEQINEEYETEKYVPNFIAIGSNGGGAGIFISKGNKRIYSIPFIGMKENDAVLLAESFSEFIYKFENDDMEII